MENTFFRQINSTEICKMVEATQSNLCYAAPGIQLEPAKFIVNLAKKIGLESIFVFLDVNENVLRMGYGELEAINILREAGIQVGSIDGLRNGLIVSDDIGFSYTPTALFLEKEATDQQSLNALKLMPEQIKEAMARLSPASKAIALAQAKTLEEKAHIEKITSETRPIPVNKEAIETIAQKLKEVPATNFDIARQVRVYEAYFQYVELKLLGVKVYQKRIEIPDSIQKITSGIELKDRLKTTVELISKNAKISNINLDDEIRKIRNNFTKPLGKEHGRIILKNAIPKFEERIANLRLEIDKYKKNIEENIQAEFDKTKEELINLYSKILIENPPDSLIGEVGTVTEDNVRSWLDTQLNNVIPKVDNISKNIELYLNYKDVTYKNLTDPKFIANIHEAYTKIDWTSVHKEFLAASENTAKKTETSKPQETQS